MIAKPIAVLTTLGLLASIAHAGEFNESNGVAIKGYDPVAYIRQNKPVRGHPDLRFDYKGSTFLFTNVDNRAAFAANPEKFQPQYGGYCAFGAASGYKADIDPASFTVVDGKLYLNYNRQVQQQWLKDTPGFIRQADERWPAVQKTDKVHR